MRVHFDLYVRIFQLVATLDAVQGDKRLDVEMRLAIRAALRMPAAEHRVQAEELRFAVDGAPRGDHKGAADGAAAEPGYGHGGFGGRRRGFVAWRGEARKRVGLLVAEGARAVCVAEGVFDVDDI